MWLSSDRIGEEIQLLNDFAGLKLKTSQIAAQVFFVDFAGTRKFDADANGLGSAKAYAN